MPRRARRLFGAVRVNRAAGTPANRVIGRFSVRTDGQVLWAVARNDGQPPLSFSVALTGRTAVLVTEAGEEGLRTFKMGSASAMSTILTIALLGVSLLLLTFMRERKERKKS